MTKRNKPASPVLKRLLTITWWVVAGVFFVIAWREFVGPDQSLGELLRPVDWWLFVLALAVLIFGQVVRAQLTYASHTALNYRVDRGEGFRYWVFSQMGKYIPGGIWLFASRTVFYQQNGMPTLIASGVVVWETLSILITGIVIVLISIPTLPVIKWGMIGSIGAAGLLIVTGVGLWQTPRFWEWLVKLRIPGASLMLRFVNETADKRTKLLRGHLILSAVSWVIIGSGFYLLTLSFPPLRGLSVLSANAIFIASWVIGFLVLIAPGGIGSREAAMIAFLLPLISPSEALAFAVIARIWWTLGEALLFLFGGGMQLLASMRAVGEPSTAADDNIETAEPFFIVGCGRSGTTLLRTMLNHHPEIAIPLESFFIVDYLRAPKTIPAARLGSMLRHEYELKEWGLDLTGEMLEGCETPRELITRLHERYAAEHGKTRWGQKTPRLIRFGGLLKTNYPKARFVIVLRDPRATVNSLMKSNVHSANVLFASKRWAADVREGLALKQTYPDDVLEIRYEDLVTQPEQNLRQVCDFLDIAYDPVMLTYHKSGVKEYSSYYDQIHARLAQPPQASRVDAWQDELKPEDVAIIESVCGDLMEQVGYQPPEQRSEVRKGRIARYTLLRIPGMFSQVFYYTTKRRGYIFNYARRKLNLGLFWRDFWQINY
ncbi:MAG: sulfotransferase [Anaerolineae bacterium]|nr:sulfotransferase [Anaerolineae bacterium]